MHRVLAEVLCNGVDYMDRMRRRRWMLAPRQAQSVECTIEVRDRYCAQIGKGCKKEVYMSSESCEWKLDFNPT